MPFRFQNGSLKVQIACRDLVLTSFVSSYQFSADSADHISFMTNFSYNLRIIQIARCNYFGPNQKKKRLFVNIFHSSSCKDQARLY